MACNFCGNDHEGNSDIIPPCVLTGDSEWPLKCPKCDKRFKDMSSTDGLMSHPMH